MIKKIIQELKTMAKRKFISKEILEILLKMPPEKLKEVCATLMYNIVFLKLSEAKKLLEASESEFNDILIKIKSRIENNNINTQITQMQYVLCKMVGFLEMKMNDEILQEEIYDIILTDVLYPLSEWLKDKSKENKNAKVCFEILKNEIFC